MTKRLQVEVTFRAARDGGRMMPPDLSAGTYRPHLLMSPASTRLPQERLGVQFVEGPSQPLAGTPEAAVVELVYPEVDYSALHVGVTFAVLEGDNVVAHGRVIGPVV